MSCNAEAFAACQRVTFTFARQAIEKIEPDADIRSFLTFIFVIVPFVMFVCLGVAALFHRDSYMV